MKNDFRLKYPLWMMAFIILLGVIAYTLDSPTMEYVNNSSETSMQMTIVPAKGILMFGAFALYLILLGVFALRMKKHNRQNPSQKISPFSIRPLEYLEQDEGMIYITRKAVQKVYTYITWALPLLATFAIIMPMPKLFVIYGILAVALGQYLIYYLEIRKYFKEEKE